MADLLDESVTLEALRVDPYPLFARLQQEEPVAWCPHLGMWLVVRRADAVAVLQDRQAFGVEHEGSLLAEVVGRMMLSTDGAEQTRLRQPFAATYLPRAVQAMAASIEARAATLVDSFAWRGAADLKTELAEPLALGTVLDSLGMAGEDLAEVGAWYADIATALGNYAGDPAVRAQGQAAVRAFGERVLTRRAAAPPGSLLAALPLSEPEIAASATILVFGGLETTAAMIGNTVWALLRHPEQLAAVRAEPALLERVVEESLRWESPVQTCTRHTARAVEVAGVAIGAGETVQCMLGAANRDPAHFPEPGRFDVRRPNAAQHLAFGTGRHFCIGAALARLEGVVAVRVLLERLPRLALDEPDPRTRPVGHEFRSLPRLRVRF